jgi:hypothetical protein
MQCKDIPVIPILSLLAKNPGQWHFMWDGEYSIFPAFPPDTDTKLVRAKMASLIKRGFAMGCTCGCRGDFEITKKGLEFLESNNDQAS